MNKELYLDFMEQAVSAYSGDRIAAYIADVRENMISEHGFCRLCANTGFLLAHGRLTDKKELFAEMMDLCCSQITFAKEKHGHRTGNDFSVKEIVICLLELEKSALFPKETTDRWREELEKINPYSTYSCIATVPPERISNVAAFSAASEQLRIYSGIGGDRAFTDNQISSQLLSFDENGMFRDPHEPVVYDMVARLQLATALYFGYDGPCRQELEEQLVKSADATLQMQSVTGEIPYGGRSNQFLHNDSFYAALCEYYASYFSSHGNSTKAGYFRKAAEFAMWDLEKWLSRDSISHIKNGYNPDEGIGCEGYAYFNKYMVTMGSWCMLAYVFADDSIAPRPYNRSFAFKTSEYFHKLILNSCTYTAELEFDPDMNYDCGGVGRIQGTGANPVICMSVPCPVNPKYKLPEPNEFPLSIAPGIRVAGVPEFALTPETKYEVMKYGSGEDYASAVIKTEMADENGTVHAVYMGIHLGREGVDITADSDTQTFVLLPAFETDGKDKSVIELCHGPGTAVSGTDVENNSVNSGSVCSLTVSFGGSKCVYTSVSDISDLNYSSYNRNGRYRAFCAGGGEHMSVHIDIIPAG